MLKNLALLALPIALPGASAAMANPLVIPEAVAMLRGKPYKPFDYSPVAARAAGRPAGDFVFDADFYRASATLNLATDAKGTTLYWPGGPEDPLLPVGKDKYMDRYYWNLVSVVRGPDGNPIALDFNEFRGTLRQK